MEISERQVVKSLAGHDKDGFFVIVALEGKYAYICDGKHRRLENPKRKRLIHISATNTVLPESDLENNRRIRKALAPFAVYSTGLKPEEV